MDTADSYSPLVETNDWKLYSQGRVRLRTAGIMAACLLIIGMAVLVDGLLSRMLGGGSYRLEMLAGTSEPISGPMGSAVPDESGMRAFPIPVDAPVSFEFGGFFSSYWFGTGMWRGTVHVSETAPSGTYGLAVGVAGQPSSTYQTYTVSVSRSVDEENARSLSLVRRITGWNPFWVTAFFLATGIGCALGCIRLGVRLNKMLRDMGLAEVFKVYPDGELMRVHVVTGIREISGTSFVCYDATLQRLGKVIVDKQRAGLTECLFVKGERGVPAKGSLVAFWEPRLPEFKPMRKGIFSNAVAKCVKPAASLDKE